MEKPTLKNLSAFKQVLSGYSMSSKAKKVLRELNFVLLAAPTASGRNTIIKELLATGNYHFVVTDTTRPPKFRDGRTEQNGVDYWFRKEEDLLADLQNGKFLEAALIHEQQVSGVSMRELESALSENKIAITDIQIDGVRAILEAKSDTTAIFVVPPSFNEWMRRIQYRGDLSEEELVSRLRSALLEISTALSEDYYHFILNNTVDEAAIAINQLSRFGIKDNDHEKQARSIAEQLYIEIKTYLSVHEAKVAKS